MNHEGYPTSAQGAQILFIVFGLVMMFRNIVLASRLGLPYTAYEDKVFLRHTLDAIQAIVMFVAALSLDPLIRKMRDRAS